jgi:nucleotide-binding universal stress UspA family protein
VLPTHGYGPFRRFILGSVTAKVLHDAECPVWTGVHMQDPLTEAVGFHKIICAIDLENHSVKPLSWAWEMGQELGSKVTIVHAIPALGSERPEYLEGKWSEYLIQQTMARIQELQDEAGTNAAVCIRAGKIAQAVAAAANDLRASIMVIGRGMATAFAGRLRTYSYAIIRESPCPVVSV